MGAVVRPAILIAVSTGVVINRAMNTVGMPCAGCAYLSHGYTYTSNASLMVNRLNPMRCRQLVISIYATIVHMLVALYKRSEGPAIGILQSLLCIVISSTLISKD
jgi:hypothetical protein